MNFDKTKPKAPAKVNSLKNRLSQDDRDSIYRIGNLTEIKEAAISTVNLMRVKKLGDIEGEAHVDFLIKCNKLHKDIYLDEENTLTRESIRKLEELEEKKENNSRINEEGEQDLFPSYQVFADKDNKKRRIKELPTSD